jgi:hypothetical protein
LTGSVTLSGLALRGSMIPALTGPPSKRPSRTTRGDEHFVQRGRLFRDSGWRGRGSCAHMHGLGRQVHFTRNDRRICDGGACWDPFNTSMLSSALVTSLMAAGGVARRVGLKPAGRRVGGVWRSSSQDVWCKAERGTSGVARALDWSGRLGSELEGARGPYGVMESVGFEDARRGAVGCSACGKCRHRIVLEGQCIAGGGGPGHDAPVA